MNELIFDADTHTYRLAGRVLPSVTQVIGTVIPGWKAAQWYLGRGLAIHHGCRLEDEGKLDWATVSDEIAPRIRAWRKFLADSGAEVAECEKQMVSAQYQFAGTMDRRLSRPGHESVVCDLKSTIEPQVRLQLGAYSLLLAGTERKQPRKAVAVELREDGSYRCLWLNAWDLRRAEQQFLACLTVFGFMKTHNLKGPNDDR